MVSKKWHFVINKQNLTLRETTKKCFVGVLIKRTEKAMAPHSSTLAWKIPWTEEPGRLQSMRSLSRTRLSDFTFTFHFHAREKEMATHFSVLAWRIPGTAEPGRLPSVGSHRVGHDWRDLAAAIERRKTTWNKNPFGLDFVQFKKELMSFELMVS